MVDGIALSTRWDDEAAVWIASSEDVPGLVVEADSWLNLLNEVRLVLPDLLELNKSVT
jgi:hypothetical protein